MPHTFRTNTDKAKEINKLTAALRDASTSFDLFKILKSITKQYGLSTFSIAAHPSSNEQTLKQRMQISNWPPGLLEHLSAVEGFDHASMITNVRETSIPLLVRFECNSDTPEDRAISKLFMDYKFDYIVFVPLRSHHGFSGVISFCGQGKNPGVEAIMEVAFICVHSHETLNEIFLSQKDLPIKLSEKQSTILNYLASGNGVSEIASLLGASRGTANYHVKSTIAALGARSAAHAVAIAYQNGILGA